MASMEYQPNEASLWRLNARCANLYTAPDMFPNENYREDVERAKGFCTPCPVRSECLSEALASGERYGVWGGLTADERAAYRKRPKKPSRAVREALASIGKD